MSGRVDNGEAEEHAERDREDCFEGRVHRLELLPCENDGAEDGDEDEDGGDLKREE